MNKSVLTFTAIQPHHLRRREEAKLVSSVTRVLLAHYFNDAQLENEQKSSNRQTVSFQTTELIDSVTNRSLLHVGLLQIPECFFRSDLQIHGGDTSARLGLECILRNPHARHFVRIRSAWINIECPARIPTFINWGLDLPGLGGWMVF